MNFSDTYLNELDAEGKQADAKTLERSRERGEL